MACDLNKPLTAEAMWQDFLEMGCIKSDATPEQLADYRLVFYAGMGTMLRTLPAKLAVQSRADSDETIAKLDHDIGRVLTEEE